MKIDLTQFSDAELRQLMRMGLKAAAEHCKTKRQRYNIVVNGVIYHSNCTATDALKGAKRYAGSYLQVAHA
jgi:hypothetical protein